MSTLTTTTTITNDEYLIQASVTSTGDIPPDVFLYENLGTTVLGSYQAVCSLDDYRRVQTFTGIAIPIFANKYVKYTSGLIHVPLGRDPVPVVNKVIADVKSFKTAYLAASSTTVTTNL